MVDETHAAIHAVIQFGMWAFFSNHFPLVLREVAYETESVNRICNIFWIYNADN